jgi:hypothetical protein
MDKAISAAKVFYSAYNIPDLVDKNISNIGNMPLRTFTGIMNNQAMFRYISGDLHAKEFTYYYNHDEVHKKFAMGNVLIYLPNLQLYQLFDDLEMYKKYIIRIDDYGFDRSIPVYELILITIEHKFIVRCDNSEKLISDIKRILPGKMEQNIDGPFAELIFDRMVSSFEQEQVLFRLIIESVPDSSIRVPVHKDHNDYNTNFVEHSVSPLYGPRNEEIIELLERIENSIKSIKPTVYKYCNVNNDCTSVTNAVNRKTVSKPKVDNRKIVEDWIANNPIIGSIPQVEYRQKFFDDTKIVIHPNTWGKLASHLLEKCGPQKSHYRNCE